MKSQLLSLLKFSIGWPLSLLAVFFIIKFIAPQTPTVLTQIQQLNPTLLFFGVFSFFLYYLVRSYIWYRLIKKSTDSISFKEACSLWSLSELKRYVPGNVWSFLGRTFLFSEKGVKKKGIAVSLVTEAELFVLGSLWVSLLSWHFLSIHFNFLSQPSIENLVFFLLGVISILFIFNGRIIQFLPLRLRAIAEHILPQDKPSETIFLIGLSVLSVIFFGLGCYFVIGSFVSLHPTLIVELTGFFVVSFLLGYLFILAPAGFGVREGLIVAGLSTIVPFATAAFASLFSRIVLVLTELIFVVLALFWSKTKSSYISKAEKFIAANTQELILLTLILLYVLYFTMTSFARYDNFYAGRFDLGNMAQTVWNTLHGRVFIFTNPNGTDAISRLAFHADFLLIFLTPFYAIWPNPKMLLLIQTIVLAAGAIFVYLIAQDVIKNKNIALAFATAYLLNPSIQRTNLYDFHAVTLATTFLLGTYYFYSKKNYWYFSLFSILAAICKEQIWLIIALFGMLLFLIQRKQIFGGIVFIISVGVFFYLVSYAIPHESGTRHFALSYYSELGDGPSKIIKTILFSPQKIAGVIISPERIHYLEQIFLPLGFLPIFYPIILIFIIPDLLINLLSNNTQLHQIYYQYTSTISPFLFIAAILGLDVIKKVLKNTLSYRINSLGLQINQLLIIYLLIMCVTASYLYGPLPFSREPNINMITRPVVNKKFIDNYLSHIPRRLSVAASNNIGSHLSQRQRIYTLPLGVDKADVIVFLLTDSEPPQSLKLERELAKKLKGNKSYKLTVEKDDFLVFVKKST